MSSRILMLRRLPWTAGKKEIIDHFSKYGKIRNAVVDYDNSGFSSGTGFIYFDNSSSVKSAVGGNHIIDDQKILSLANNNLL